MALASNSCQPDDEGTIVFQEKTVQSVRIDDARSRRPDWSFVRSRDSKKELLATVYGAPSQ
jgi:hypothetical protein